MPQTVNLTGTLIYKPEKCWNGFVLIPSSSVSKANGARLIDMNGNVVNKWEGVFGAFDNKLIPGGDIIGSTGEIPGVPLEMLDLIQVDWQGNLVWKAPDTDEQKINGEIRKTIRAHHDFQREGNPVGYYAPNQLPMKKGKTLINSNKNVLMPHISPYVLSDSRLLIVDENGEICWSWQLMEHFEELGLSEAAKNAFFRFPGIKPHMDYAKETYLNNCAWLGPNKWYDNGDMRFHPENIITDIRSLNISFIIDHISGEIVWRLGPDYDASPALRKLGAIIGQHEVHMIPKGLPGEGNILIFDNGGHAGYGLPNANSPTGQYNQGRCYSRVLEIDPATLEIVWSYGDYRNKLESELSLFFSAICSGMQRLPNGNTQIVEATSGRIFEVTPEGEIVWEYVDPAGFAFRAHRYPYDWVPVQKPVEKAIAAPQSVLITLGERPQNIDDSFFTRKSIWR